MFFPFCETETVTVLDPLTVIDPVRSASALASAFTSRVALPLPEVFPTWIQDADGVAVQSFSVEMYTSFVDVSSASKEMDSGLTVRLSFSSGLFPVGSQETERKRAATRGSMGNNFRIMVQYV